jgi:hypothetical protein
VALTGSGESDFVVGHLAWCLLKRLFQTLPRRGRSSTSLSQKDASAEDWVFSSLLTVDDDAGEGEPTKTEDADAMPRSFQQTRVMKIWWCLAVSTVVFSLQAQALTGPVTRATLTASAERVVVGWNDESVVVDETGRLDLITRHVIRVEHTLLERDGAATGDVIVVTEGGRMGNVVVVVEDEAVIAVGSRLVLWLASDDQGRARVVGGDRGVVVVNSDAEVSHLAAHLHDDVLLGASPVGPRVQPFFETNEVHWGGVAPVAETFRLHLPGFAGIIDDALVEDRFTAALEVWGREGGAPVALRFGGLIDNDEYGGGDNDENTTHGGASILLFTSLAAARTTIVDDKIVDCDIRVYERNRSGTIAWTASPIGADDGENDLENTFIHELGHCLGLAHSAIEDAIMFATTPTGTSEERRHLHPDDVAGLQSLYGVGSLPAEGEGEGEGEGDGEGDGEGEGEGEGDGEGDGEGEGEGEGDDDDNGVRTDDDDGGSSDGCMAGADLPAVAAGLVVTLLSRRRRAMAG